MRACEWARSWTCVPLSAGCCSAACASPRTTGSLIPRPRAPGLGRRRRCDGLAGLHSASLYPRLEPGGCAVSLPQARLVYSRELQGGEPPLVLFPSTGEPASARPAAESAACGRARGLRLLCTCQSVLACVSETRRSEAGPWHGWPRGHACAGARLSRAFLLLAGGNLHEFKAQTPCAVLDLLTPPYEPPERDCSYFRVKQPPVQWPLWPRGAQQQGSPQQEPAARVTVTLEVYEPPASFEVVSGSYAGETVQ
jgi:hypothetical protein